MGKVFTPHDVVRDNGLKLARKICDDGFMPDVIYVSLRGGACLGNIISEYFKLVTSRNNLKPVLYAAVVARSYLKPGAARSARISVDGWTYNPEYLRSGDRVLLIDDIYDTGNTIDYLANIIMRNGIDPQQLKIAVHDYKERVYIDNSNLITPHYYCRKITVTHESKSDWIHYMGHELVDLTQEEIERYYSAEVQSILTDLPSS